MRKQRFKHAGIAGQVIDCGHNTLAVCYGNACIHLDYTGRGASFGKAFASKVRDAARTLGYELDQLALSGHP